MYADEKDLVDEIELDIPSLLEIEIPQDRPEDRNFRVAENVVTRRRILGSQTSAQKFRDKRRSNLASCEQVLLRQVATHFVTDTLLAGESRNRSTAGFVKAKRPRESFCFSDGQ